MIKYKPSFRKHQLRQKCSIKTKEFSFLTDFNKTFQFTKSFQFCQCQSICIFGNNSKTKAYFNNKKIVMETCLIM